MKTENKSCLVFKKKKKSGSGGWEEKEDQQLAALRSLQSRLQAGQGPRCGHEMRSRWWGPLGCAASPGPFALRTESCPVDQLSHSVLSDSWRPHGLRHTRLPCPSPTPGACSDSCPLSWWCHPTISSSVLWIDCTSKNILFWGKFPVGLVVRIWGFPCYGLGSITGREALPGRANTHTYKIICCGMWDLF